MDILEDFIKNNSLLTFSLSCLHCLIYLLILNKFKKIKRDSTIK